MEFCSCASVRLNSCGSSDDNGGGGSPVDTSICSGGSGTPSAQEQTDAIKASVPLQSVVLLVWSNILHKCMVSMCTGDDIHTFGNWFAL